MNKILFLCVMLSLSAAAPISEDAQARILTYVNEINGDGNYEFRYKTSNGIFRSESGLLVNVGQPDEHLEVHGAYSYTDAEGKLIKVYYTADKNGYRFREGILPPAPPQAAPIPPAAVATLIG